MAAPVKTRVFIVGCPRSGTTLLQSILAAHPQVFSIPESHFFAYLVPRLAWVRTLGVASLRVRGWFKHRAREIGLLSAPVDVPLFAVSMRRYCALFVSAMDWLAQQEGKDLWMEKTPRHLWYIPYIERHVPEAKFIHILRNGADAVASLFQVTHQYPAQWSRPRSIEECVTRWIDDVRISLAHRGRPDHTLVTYRRLTTTPAPVVAGVCEFLGIPFHDAMLKEYGTAASQVITDSEPWKASVGTGIRDGRATKFYEVFDEQQRHYVLDRLAAARLDTVEEL